MRGRFAPSPTGAMHLGNARTALVAWLAVRHRGGAMVLRVEDLDQPRVVPGATERLLEDLRWLGLDWDEGPDLGGPFGPYRQSQRARHYDEAVEALLARDAAFLCACSRADVARAASAPHEDLGNPGDDGPRYPGTCLLLPTVEVRARSRALGRQPVVRFRGKQARIPFTDEIQGPSDPFGEAGVDDFVLRRSDGTAAYQLAVVVDDAAMRISHVVRGADLVRSTPRQIALYGALGLPSPVFAHAPLVLSAAGERLAKRTRPVAVSALRNAGLAPDAVVGALAASLGLCPTGGRAHPRDLIDAFAGARLPRTPSAIEALPHVDVGAA